MDYLKTAIPSQLIAERSSNLVVINPGSVNVRIGLSPQDIPLNVPRCIAHLEREKAYDIHVPSIRLPV